MLIYVDKNVDIK